MDSFYLSKDVNILQIDFMLQPISSVVYHIWRQTEEKLAYEVQLSATLMFQPHSDVLCDLSLNTVSWGLFCFMQ